MNPAIFLDRDGVLIRDVGYLADVAQIEVLPTVPLALQEIAAAGFARVVVTNQAGVARGFFPESRIAEVHAQLDTLFQAAGVAIDGYFYCPHHPREGQEPYRRTCDCRKPRPGLLLQGARELQLDLGQSFLIGDKLSDLEAGAAAGCRTVLVRTGYGTHYEPQTVTRESELRLLGVADTLLAAVRLCIAAHRSACSK